MTSKYDGLADHLATIGTPIVTMTFAEVEAIVGPLPETARRSVEWWGVTVSGRYTNAHALGWWLAGYVADRPDFAAHTATYRRLAR
jgi:hypothetical protein